jgi:hypothetical protein
LFIESKKIKVGRGKTEIELNGENGGSLYCYYKPELITVYITMTAQLRLLKLKSKITMTPTWRIKWKLLQDQVK